MAAVTVRPGRLPAPSVVWGVPMNSANTLLPVNRGLLLRVSSGSPGRRFDSYVKSAA